MKKYIITAAVLISALSGALYAEETKPSESAAPKKRGRPAHTFDFSSTGYDGGESHLRAALDDRLFTVGDDLPVYNTLKCDRLTTDMDGVPSRLYTVSDTVMAMSDDMLLFGMVSSPSDKPFNSMDEVLLMGAASKEVWKSGNHSLSAAVFMSNTKYWGYYIPIPFMAYRYKDDSLTASFGVPSMIFWKIAKGLNFRFSYFPVFNFETALQWSPLPFITLGPELAYIQNKYYIAGRADKEQNLYKRYLSIAFGVQSYINSFSGVYLKAGYIPYNVYVTGTSSMEMHGTRDAGTELFVTGGFRFFLF